MENTAPRKKSQGRQAKSAVDVRHQMDLAPQETRQRPGVGEPEFKNVLPLLRMRLEGGATWDEAHRFLVSSGLRPKTSDQVLDALIEGCLNRSRSKAYFEFALALGFALGAGGVGVSAGGVTVLSVILAIAGLILVAAALTRLTNGGLSEVSAKHNFWRLTPNEKFIVGEFSARTLNYRGHHYE